MEINISYFAFELTFDSSFCSATCPVFAFHYFFVTSMYTCSDTMLKKTGLAGGKFAPMALLSDTMFL